MCVKCQYCNTAARLTTGKELSPHNLTVADMQFYTCDTCYARVGVHKGTTKPMGTLANKSLRKTRSKAHKSLDIIYKQGYTSRSKMYQNLAYHMQIPFKFCHIAYMNAEQCEETIRWAKEEVKKYESNAESAWVGEEENLFDY